MRTELKRLHERLKATFIYVTHDQAKAMTIADRIVVMSKGRIEQFGTPLDIYNKPATQFVASFFGTPTMNFLEGTMESDGSGVRFRSAHIQLNLSGLPGVRAAGAAARQVVLGIRAEHVLIDDAGTSMGPARLLEPLGDATLVHFEASDGQSLVAKVSPATTVTPGAPMSYGFDPQRCHLFDATSRERID